MASPLNNNTEVGNVLYRRVSLSPGLLATDILRNSHDTRMGSTTDMSEAEDLPPLAESTTVVETTKEAPYILTGEGSQIIFHDEDGQVKHVGRQGTIVIYTNECTFRSTDVKTEIVINVISPNEDLPAPDTNTPMLGATAESGHVQDDIEMRVDVENNDTRHRLRTDEETLSRTRSCLSSLFRGVNMVVQRLWRGSIIIGLQPKTERAVLTLMEAMEEGFLEALVKNILENQIASNTDSSAQDVNEPIKMKIEVNIPKAMFPKNFKCRRYSSMAEIIEELKITLRQQEFEKERKEADRKLVKLVIERSKEETRKRKETSNTVRYIAGKTETLGMSLTIALSVGSVAVVAGIFTFGSTTAASAAGCAALVAAFIAAISEVAAQIEIQRKLTEYDLTLKELFDALSLLLDTEDKESIRCLLNEALKDQRIDAKNKTLKILLEDLNAVRLGNMFTVPVDEDEVRLKDFDVLQYIKKLITQLVQPSTIGRDLRKLADDLDQHQVLVR